MPEREFLLAEPAHGRRPLVAQILCPGEGVCVHRGPRHGNAAVEKGLSEGHEMPLRGCHEMVARCVCGPTSGPAATLALFVFLFLSGAGSPALAQEQQEEKPEGVQYNAVAGAALTQTNYADWAEGGEDALAYVLRFKGRISEERLHDKWNVDGAVGFGQTKIGDEETRVSVNELVLEALYSYKLPKQFSTYAAGGFRSAIVTGYDYSVEPKLEKASFNDPGYYTLSLGAAYVIKPEPTHFRTRLGLGFKYTTAETHFQFGYADDPDTPEKDKSKLETGIDSVTELDAKIAENIICVSKLAMFSRFEELAVWDIRWENTVTAQINKYVSTQFELVLLFDKDVSGRLQRFQMLSIGISYAIL